MLSLIILKISILSKNVGPLLLFKLYFVGAHLIFLAKINSERRCQNEINCAFLHRTTHLILVNYFDGNHCNKNECSIKSCRNDRSADDLKFTRKLT